MGFILGLCIGALVGATAAYAFHDKLKALVDRVI